MDSGRKSRRGFCGRAFAIAGTMTPLSLSLELEDSAEDGYPVTHIGRLSSLDKESARSFLYLSDSIGPHFMVRLDRKCNRGVGPGENIVAFHGVDLNGEDVDLDQNRLVTASQCYDLANGGRVIRGSNDRPLTPVRLVVKGRDIYATGYSPA